MLICILGLSYRDSNRGSWTSPFADASGRAGVNQARFAVLAMRLSSLTLLLTAAFISGVRLSRGQFRIPTQACSLHFREAKVKCAEPALLIPTISRGRDSPRSKPRRGCGPAQPLAFGQGPLGACLRSRVPVASL